MESTMEDRIRQHAYFLWLNNGGAGDANYFWLAAEREVMAEVEKDAAPVLEKAPAVFPTAPPAPARRVNALVLLESEQAEEESALGIAAE